MTPLPLSDGDLIQERSTSMLTQAAKRSPQTSLLLTALAALLSLSALFLLTAATRAASASPFGPAKPTVVLVHGAWADASGWSQVIERLQKDGYRVLAPANPLRSLDGDAAYLQSILAQEEGPFVVVGHSYGGAVITNAAAGNPDVDALVYVNAFVPDIGEDILHLAGEGTLVPSSIEFKGYPPFGPTDVDIYIKRTSFRETLAGDLSTKDAAVLAVTQRPLSLAAASGATTATAWKTIPSWYLLGTEDRTITPAAQRFMAERAGATIEEVKASHLSLISRPGTVAELIEEAAAATSQG
jgi:pimeloyl-ACP methyl ester carboxylesterase